MKAELISQHTVLSLIRVRYPDSVEWNKAYQWCKENITGEWYSGRDWDTSRWVAGGENRCMEFVNEEDAVLFALRWA